MVFKDSRINGIIVLSVICSCFFFQQIHGVKHTPQKKLRNLYEYLCKEPYNLNEHLPLLRKLSKECSSVVEIGVYRMVSTCGILQGLSENKSKYRSYLGIDIGSPPLNTLKLFKNLAKGNNISFNFLKANDMDVEIDNTELLFIDSLHTYCHLTYELEKFSPKVTKYIALHDTSPPWGYADDSEYNGDYSEYPSHIDRTKRGLWPAVEDFLKQHPEWVLHERYFNNYGFTILKRISHKTTKSS